MSFQKVFGIGLNKTGTTTLGQCAEILGYRHMGCDRSLLADIVLNQNLDRAFTIIEQFNFFEDWPWPLIYREIDKQFPNSKFILTVRDNEQAWLASLKRHALIRHPLHHSRRLAYGYDYPHGHEEAYLAFYRAHNHAVRTHFEGRQADFIELSWENGDEWHKLCHFLKCEIPAVPFPHANNSAKKRVYKTKWLANRAMSLLKYRQNRQPSAWNPTA